MLNESIFNQSVSVFQTSRISTYQNTNRGKVSDSQNRLPVSLECPISSLDAKELALVAVGPLIEGYLETFGCEVKADSDNTE